MAAPPAITPLVLLDTLYRQRHTGTVVLHLQNGVPRLAELGAPERIVLADPTTDLSPALDNPVPPRAG